MHEELEIKWRIFGANTRQDKVRGIGRCRYHGSFGSNNNDKEVLTIKAKRANGGSAGAAG